MTRHDLTHWPEFKQLKTLDAKLAALLSQSEALHAWLQRELRLDHWQTYNLNAFPPLLNSTVEAVLRAMDLPAEVHEATHVPTPTHQRGNWYWPSAQGYDERLEWVTVGLNTIHLRYVAQKRHYELEVQLPAHPPERLAALSEVLTDRHTLTTLVNNPLPALPSLLEAGFIVPWRQWRLFANTKQPSALALGTGVRFVARLFTLYPVILPLWHGLEAAAVCTEVIRRELAAYEAARHEALQRLPTDPHAFWAPFEAVTEPTMEPVDDEAVLDVMRHLPASTLWPKPEENALFMAACEKTYKAVARKIHKLRLEASLRHRASS